MYSPARELRRNIAVVILCWSTLSVAGVDWPAFRGPDGNGVAREKKAPASLEPYE
jgi:hypothetical protein